MACLDQTGHTLVSAAVSDAESRTAGEIVTVLAERSDGYTDVALLWAVGVAFTAMSFFALLPESILGCLDGMMGGWTHEWTQGETMTVMMAVGLIAFFAMWAVQLWERLRFFLIPPSVEAARVRKRAVALFKVGAERRTHGRTGVLIYLSMREHRAEIVADAAIATKVAPEVWGAAMADMLAEIRQGRIAEGLAEGVRDVGAILAEHFPRAEDDVNELPDRLIEV